MDRDPERRQRPEGEPEPDLAEKVLRLHDALAADDVPHAFGGALAADYYRVPRATIDIDVNVFVPGEEHERVVRALERAFSPSDTEALVKDIVVFKALFDRPQDWLGVEAIRELQSDNLDVAYVTSWLTELVGGDHTRIERLKQLG